MHTSPTEALVKGARVIIVAIAVVLALRRRAGSATPEFTTPQVGAHLSHNNIAFVATSENALKAKFAECLLPKNPVPGR